MFNFANDLSVQFGYMEEFFIQWRQRFFPELLDTHFEGELGWKQLVLRESDRTSFVSPSCTQLEVVVSNSNQYGFPQMYHSCRGKDGQFEPLFQRNTVEYKSKYDVSTARENLDIVQEWLPFTLTTAPFNSESQNSEPR
jgi:hypothetical protein